MSQPDPRPWTDEELARLLMKRPTHANLAEAYRRFFPLALWVAGRVLGFHHAHAEDVAQETLTRVLRPGSLASLARPAALRGYIAAVARRAAIDAYRKLSREPLHAVAEVDAIADSVAEAEAASRTRDALLELLAVVSADERELLEMRYVKGLTLAEIAEQLHTTYSAVGQRLSRARHRALRKLRRRPMKT